jgi:hypothetical protein
VRRPLSGGQHLAKEGEMRVRTGWEGIVVSLVIFVVAMTLMAVVKLLLR